MNEMAAAGRRAARFYGSKQFRMAYVRGARAALDGRPADSCPYRSREGWKAWRKAWLRGYESVKRS